MDKIEEELKSQPLDESERGEWKSWLKTQHSVNENQVIQSHHFMANRWGNNGNSDSLFSWAPKSLQMVTSVLKLKRHMLLGRKAMTNLDSMLKSRDIILPTKFCLVKTMVFPVVRMRWLDGITDLMDMSLSKLLGVDDGQGSLACCSPWGHKESDTTEQLNWTVWMWELDHKESWALKNWCFWTVVLEKTLESPLDCREIQSVHPKDQSWVFIGRTGAEAEAPILWPPDVKNWLIGKDPDGGKDWRREEKGMTEDEIVGWHHQLDGREFEQAPGTWLCNWTDWLLTVGYFSGAQSCPTLCVPMD